MTRDYDSSPADAQLGLRDIILGLSGDLQDLREGKISPADALARAALAKQVFNGVRLYLAGSAYLEKNAKDVKALK